MIHAYHEILLRKAKIKVGDMFDFAVNEFGIDGEDFATMFAGSSIAYRLEVGEPKYLAGMSGIELALLVIEEKTGIVPVADDVEHLYRTPHHWCGWAICHYQWISGLSYKEILEIAPYPDLMHMYRTLHEADISKFIDVMERKRSSIFAETNLKRIRSAYGCSQSELAQKSGVSLRSIQMYEQRNKDINKAQSAFLLGIARTLGCRIEDLLEPTPAFLD